MQKYERGIKETKYGTSKYSNKTKKEIRYIDVGLKKQKRDF